MHGEAKKFFSPLLTYTSNWQQREMAVKNENITGKRDGKAKKSAKSKRLRENIKKLDATYQETIDNAKSTEVLLQESEGFLEPENDMEKTFKIMQEEILENVDDATKRKAIDLKLDQYGPYTIDYSRNGRGLLVAGKRGHVASMDWQLGKLNCELNLSETVNAVKHLHNDQFFAVAQKKYTFIYDKLGTELHRLDQHIEVKHMEFLPYHFLLATAGNTGYLKYQDVSSGQLVSELRTKLGPTLAMKQNPSNAVIHLGHSNGQVTLWSPAMPKPLVKLLAARGPVKSLSINRTGNYMAVTSTDKTVKIWDLRMLKELKSVLLPSPGLSSDISDKDILSVSFGPHINIYKDIFSKPNENANLYMRYLNPGSKIESQKFVPFEDILSFGHERGVKNIIVPGSGEANFDSLEINPFESAKQRQQTEVRSLINKLPYDMISLNPEEIGTVDKRASTVRLTAKDLSQVSKEPQEVKIDIKPKVKGKNSALRRHLRKKSKNVIDERKLRIESNLKKEKELRQKIHSGKPETEADILQPALGRFK